MMKWEYLFISCGYVDGAWRPTFANGQEVSGWQTTSIYDYCNALGADGWELVNLATTDRTWQRQPGYGSEVPARGEQTFRLVFKRPSP
jgi:hypothetical protein